MKRLYFPAALMSLLLSSCGHIYTKSHSYQKSGTVTINGAKVRGAVKPEGGKGGVSMSAMVYMAGAATLDGPFRWRIEAEGVEGSHQSLRLQRVKVITSKTKRSEWYPSEHLGKAVPFKPFKKEPGKVFANFQIPGKLKVYPSLPAEIIKGSRKDPREWEWGEWPSEAQGGYHQGYW